MVEREGIAEFARKTKILVVDDERLIADTLVEILNRNGFQARAAYNGRAAIEEVANDCPEIFLSDVVMPGLNGIEAAKLVRTTCPEVRILLFSGQAATRELLLLAKAQGYEFELLPKPLHPESLMARLRETTS